MPRTSTRSRALRATAVLGSAALLVGVNTWPRAEESKAASTAPAPRPPAPAATPTAPAVTGDAALGLVGGVAGPSYGADVSAPTRDNAQSKLWFQDDTWWGVMVDQVTGQVRVHELVGDTWRDTGGLVDERRTSTADVHWDGRRLHVVSRTSGGDVRYLRLDYLPGERTYVAGRGSPVVLASGGAVSASITVDSRGRPWVTFVDGLGRVRVTHSEPRSLTSWVAPFSPPVGEATLATDDDVSAVDALDGRVALMWSNQRTGAFHLVTHDDAATDLGGWDELETPVQGELMSDGHLSLVVGPDGSLYAAVKTSQDDRTDQVSGAEPLSLVLERSPAGEWTTHVAGLLADSMTRPALVLSEQERRLYLVYTAPAAGGAVHYKISDLDAMSWGAGRGTSLMAVPGGLLNNPTSTKQSVDATSGILVLATDDASRRYFHARIGVDAPSG